MSNRKINQTIKERCIELEESGSYQLARDEEFNEQFTEFIVGTPTDTPLTEDDVQGFLDSFEFPDEFEWIADEVESEAGDYADQAYEEYKERDI